MGLDQLIVGQRLLVGFLLLCTVTVRLEELFDVSAIAFFKFSFGKAGNCTVNIKTELGYNIVELVQENIPDDDEGKHNWHVGCKTGWTFYLANMKSLCEGGIDLRNRDEQLKNMLNA